MSFDSPWWLLTLVLVAGLLVAYLLLQVRRAKYAARFSDSAMLGSLTPRRPGWRRHLTFGLLLAALAVLAVGVAKPTHTERIPQDRATVIVAIDVSESMNATDVLPSRIAAAKTAAAQFTDQLPARINVGLVKFGGAASVVVPPTVDRDMIKNAITSLALQNSTAIGDAVFSSLEAIKVFGAASTTAGNRPPPARIVLLSDGGNNAGRPVSQAITAAKAAGVPVSTIAFGTANGTVEIDGAQVQVPADQSTLAALAQQTGGSFHTATTAQELRTVYQDIGSQIGYTEGRRDISWRFLALGVLLAIMAAAASMLRSGRLV